MRRRVVWSERRAKTSRHPEAIYRHYYRVRLDCGCWTNLRAIAGGYCPQTTICENWCKPRKKSPDSRRRALNRACRDIVYATRVDWLSVAENRIQPMASYPAKERAEARRRLLAALSVWTWRTPEVAVRLVSELDLS